MTTVAERFFGRKPTTRISELDETGQKIMQAFIGPHKEWRTLWGIAKESGLPRETVRNYIEQHPEHFIEADMTLGGTALFTTTVLTRDRLVRRPDDKQ